jgi:hypothetical protein
LQHCNSYGLRNKLNEIYVRHIYPKPEEKEEPVKEEQPKGQTERKCYNCESFYRSWFCGYGACECKIHGSLDVDQKERHPDTAAESCPDFKSK